MSEEDDNGECRGTIIVTEEAKASCLNPRQYQSQLYEKAKTENVIAWLGTGSGKTLISVLLLKYMFNLEVQNCQEADHQKSQDAEKSRRRISLFLVNRIPLVRQQAQVILNNSYLQVAELYGDYSMGLDLGVKVGWDKLFRYGKYDVIVSTAQVILDGLTHGFLKIHEINLIIFDEAHHAYKMDSYARIMQDHYFETSVELRPKIFGMTASPLKTFGNFNEAVSVFERKLDAKIYTASIALKKEMDTYFTPPEEHMIEYKPSVVMRRGSITELIEDKCGHLEGIGKTLGRMAFNDFEYGPIFSDLAWLGNSDEFKGRVKRKLQQSGAIDSDFDLISKEWIQTEAMRRMQQRTDNEIEIRKRTKYVNEAAANSAICEILRGLPPIPDVIELDHSNAQPKLLKLMEILRTCGSAKTLREQFCCILFVKRQQTAIALTEMIKRLEYLKDWLRPEWITGHNSDYGEGMDPRAQAETLQRFGKFESTNLLVATTVAEEGLDISPCNCVIRMDLFDHHAGYVQSKGRARHRSSKFIVMLERGNVQHYNVISSVYAVEKDISQYLLGLPSDQGAIASLDEGGEEFDEDDYNNEPTITSPITGACLRPLDCISIVCRYVSSLSRDEFSLQKPEFFYMEDDLLGYRVELRFPANSKIRSIKGTWCISKRKASRTASFEACKLLYQSGELNENLLPRKIKKVEDSDGNGDVILSDKLAIKKSIQGHFNEISKRTPSMYYEGISLNGDFNESLMLYGVTIKAEVAFPQDRSRSIILLLPRPIASLPQIELMLGSDIHVIPATNDSITYHLNHIETQAARLCTLNMLCLLSRQVWKGDSLPYLILPCNISGDTKSNQAIGIDWTEVHRLANAPNGRCASYEFILQRGIDQDLLLCEMNDPSMGRLYEIDTIRLDLNAFSIISNSKTQETFYDKACRRYSYRYKDASLAPPSSLQPLLQAKSVSRPSNLLPTRVHNTEKANHNRGHHLLIPSLTWVLPCSASTFKSFSLFPSIMQRYEQLCLARDLNSTLFKDSLDEQYLMEALTISSANQAFDYQKFEFYGDCYLKMMATCWSFAKCESDREGDLNGERKKVISNKALRIVALNKNLAEYTTSQSLIIKKWKPQFLSSENLTSVESVLLSDKTISDLVESILGAAWGGGEELDLEKVNECAGRLEILGPGVKVDLKHFNNLFEAQVKKREVEETWRARVEAGTLTRLQEQIEYKFISPHLALEAVTHGSTLCSNLPSYERLEFLGDAILDFFVISLFRHKFSHLEPGQMTAMKGNAISNASLAVLCIDLELNRFLMHSSKPLSQNVTLYKDELQKAKAKQEVEFRLEGKEAVPYWLDLQPPKVLADMIEAMLGAVFVDSGFDLYATKRFFDAKYKHHFDIYFRPEVAIVRTNYDFMQIVKSLRCTTWELLVEEEGDYVITNLVFHGKILARYASRSGKDRVKRIVEYQDELEIIRAKGREERRAFIEYINGHSLKSLLQYCFPRDYIRSSTEIKEGSDVVDLKEQNRYNHLSNLCNCWHVLMMVQDEAGELKEGEEEEEEEEGEE